MFKFKSLHGVWLLTCPHCGFTESRWRFKITKNRKKHQNIYHCWNCGSEKILVLDWNKENDLINNIEES